MSKPREAISVRNTRLTKALLVKNDTASKETLSKEKLLDAFIVLYDECNREKIKRTDRNVGDFIMKCKAGKNTFIEA